jgi:hypothetical protein
LYQPHHKIPLYGGLYIPLLYEAIGFKHNLADTQDITVNPTTTSTPISKNNWIIIGAAAAAGVLLIGVFVASSNKGSAQKK